MAVNTLNSQVNPVLCYDETCEPRLDDLYKDPLLLAILKRDGIKLSMLKEVIKMAQDRLSR